MISNYDISLVSVMHMLKEVCSMTTSFPANYFFSVFISKELVTAIHYDKSSVLYSRKFEGYEENYGSPTFLKVPAYSTELVSVIFV